jgi:hypothetical protein
VQRILNNWFVKWVLAPVAVLWALGWGYFQINYPTCTFRYKLTAEVMTPDGLKSGSSVVEVSYTTQSAPLSQGGRFDSVLGEAAYVDLGDGKNLFVTLGTLDSAQPVQHWYSPNRGSPLIEPSAYENMKGALDPIWLPIKIFRLGRTPGNEREMCWRVSKFKDGTVQSVELSNLPTLVTFSDMHQPLTAKTVNPNDLATTFGAGYFMTAKIEITTKKVTHVIDGVLPWARTDDRSELYDNGRELNRLTRQWFYKTNQNLERSYLAN